MKSCQWDSELRATYKKQSKMMMKIPHLLVAK